MIHSKNSTQMIQLGFETFHQWSSPPIMSIHVPVSPRNSSGACFLAKAKYYKQIMKGYQPRQPQQEPVVLTILDDEDEEDMATAALEDLRGGAAAAPRAVSASGCQPAVEVLRAPEKQNQSSTDMTVRNPTTRRAAIDQRADP